MKKIFSILLTGLISTLPFTSCMDDFDTPDTDNFLVTSPTSVGEVNTTIGELKDRYCASNAGADFSRNASNFCTKVKEDLVIEGVVVANDVSGNLYQTLMIRNIDAAAGTDQSIIVGVKNTCLYPYFPLGQRIRINLNGLYVGCYSKVPRIGQPYYTSKGNLNLGPMLLNMCATNVELIGKPDLSAPELVAEDLTTAEGEAWLRASANRIYKNVPRLVTVSGLVKEVQGAAKDRADKGENSGELEPLPKILAPEALYDDGYGVDRTIALKSNTSSVTLRTSTQNEIAFLPIPTGLCSYTGMLTYYDGWQIQLRMTSDIQNLETAE